jgi:hypothetical protein
LGAAAAKHNVSKYLEKEEALTDPESETPRKHVGDEGNQGDTGGGRHPRLVRFSAAVVPSTQEPAAVVAASKCRSALRP